MKIRFVIPGDLETRTGGYGYDRRVAGALRDIGHDVEIVPLAGDFPTPSAASLDDAEARLAAIPDGSPVLVDGLGFGPMHAIVARHAARLDFTALVHHPLCLETGLDPDLAATLEEQERRALSHARHVVVTGEETAREIGARFGVPPSRISTILPGCDRGARATSDGGPARIVSVGTLSPRKGHDTLIAALARLTDLDWRATIAGDPGAYPETAAALHAQARGAGLADRVSFVGSVESVRPLLAAADIFALASHYEGYGMAFAEALSHGLPVVGCRAGAVAGVVPPGAGLLVPPGDAAAFAEALRGLIADPERRARFSEGAWRAGQALPTWDDAGRAFAAILAVAESPAP